MLWQAKAISKQSEGELESVGPPASNQWLSFCGPEVASGSLVRSGTEGGLEKTGCPAAQLFTECWHYGFGGQGRVQGTAGRLQQEAVLEKCSCCCCFSSLLCLLSSGCFLSAPGNYPNSIDLILSGLRELFEWQWVNPPYQPAVLQDWGEGEAHSWTRGIFQAHFVQKSGCWWGSDWRGLKKRMAKCQGRWRPGLGHSLQSQAAVHLGAVPLGSQEDFQLLVYYICSGALWSSW